MINIDYLGLRCGVCGKDFQENDDVVVCPECGTPSHRTCYKENKGCPNLEKHGTDFVFEGFDKIKESARGVKNNKSDSAADSNSGELQNSEKEKTVECNPALNGNFPRVSVRKEIPCPYCGEMNKSEANYCNRCGAKFAKIQPVPVLNTDGSGQAPGQPNTFNVPTVPQTAAFAPDPLAGIPSDVVFEDNVTAADLAGFVSINTPYYMRAFDLHKRNRKKFNLSACVFSGIWFLYRKLYKIGSLIFSIEMLLYAIRFYVQQRYSVGIMNTLMTSVGLDPDKITKITFEQYMKMSDTLMNMPVNDQLMFMIPSVLFFLQIVLMIVCGIVANKLYYRHCIKCVQSIKQMAKEESLDKSETAQALYLGGGVNPFVAGAFSLLYLILFR